MRRTRAALAAAALALAAGGCVIKAAGPKQVLKPEGETVTVAPAQHVTVTGELLGLRGERLVVLSGGRLVEVAAAPDTEVKVEGYPSVKAGKREKLLLYARFPQGLSEAQWAELLRHQGQVAFDAAPAP